MDALELLDWKRRVFALYADVRAADDPRAARTKWRAGRDDLFASHPQSPIPAHERAAFPGLSYFDYDPDLRCPAALSPAEPEHLQIGTSDGEAYGFTRTATALFTALGRECSLPVYWLDGYGGGVFVPFRDATAGAETYGAGRYVLDTVKGADLGVDGDRLVLDFNFAYNPSCAYDPRWVCPLAPPDSRLAIEVRAGERTPGA